MKTWKLTLSQKCQRASTGCAFNKSKHEDIFLILKTEEGQSWWDSYDFLTSGSLPVLENLDWKLETQRFPIGIKTREEVVCMYFYSAASVHVQLYHSVSVSSSPLPSVCLS